jgi:hypothetical protein
MASVFLPSKIATKDNFGGFLQFFFGLHRRLGLLALLLGSPLVLAHEPGGQRYEGVCTSLAGLRDTLRGEENQSTSSRLEGLRREWAQLKQERADFLRPEIDLRRLLDPTDYFAHSASVRPTADSMMAIYGETVSRDWLETADWIQRNHAQIPVNPSTLREIHRRACAHLLFSGYEGRRVLQEIRAGRLTREEAEGRLQAIRQGRPIQTIDHQQLRGVYRSDPLDEVEHRGSLTESLQPSSPGASPGGVRESRTFSERELQGVRAIPWMRVEERSVRQNPNRTYTALTFYASPSQIEAAVAQVFSDYTRLVNHQSDPVNRLQAALDLQVALVGIHPFLDGNGRTIRLLLDLIYLKEGLPVPLEPFQEEFTLSRQERMEFVLRRMHDAVRARRGAGS